MMPLLVEAAGLWKIVSRNNRSSGVDQANEERSALKRQSTAKTSDDLGRTAGNGGWRFFGGFVSVPTLIGVIALLGVLVTSAGAQSMQNDAQVAKMIETLIGKSDLTQYFHVDELPQRLPIRVEIADPERFSGGAAFGRPIEWVAPSEQTDESSALAVTIEASNGDETQIDFRYPPEGVVGNAVFSAGAEPSLKTIRIIER